MDGRATSAFEDICEKNRTDISFDLKKYDSAVSIFDTYIDKKTETYYKFFCIGYQIGRKDSEKLFTSITPKHEGGKEDAKD